MTSKKNTKKKSKSAWALWLNVYRGHPSLGVREKQVLHSFYPTQAGCELAGKFIAKGMNTSIYTITPECAETEHGEWVTHDT